MTPKKIGGLIILALGLPFGVFVADRILLSAYLCLGLMLIFFSRESVEDERVRQRKMKALFLAMSSALGAILATNLDRLDFIADGRPRRAPHGFSAPELLALLILFATVMFYYWRWQDGREVKRRSLRPELPPAP